MSPSIPVPSSAPTTSAKLPRADPLVGQWSAHDNMALPINCIQPTGVFIKVCVDGREQKCFVDTGATVSLVSRQLVLGPLQPCSLQARGIGGENLHVLGITEWQKSPFSWRTCMANMHFLKAGEKLVDVANAKLSWESGEMQLLVETTKPSINILGTLLQNYSDVFVNEPSDPLGLTTQAEHVIDTGDSYPIKQRPYRIPEYRMVNQ